MLVRLRIALTDRPGALASVAAVIAEHGGNIEAVDVLAPASSAGGSGGRVVDDVTVAFSGDAPLEALRDGIEATGTATIVSSRAAAHRDPVVLVLEWARTLQSGAHADQVDAALSQAIGELCAAPVSWVERVGRDDLHPVAAMAAAQGGAVSAPAEGLSPDRAARLPGGGWLLAVPDTGSRVVLAARGGHGYTATEIARIEALMALGA